MARPEDTRQSHTSNRGYIYNPEKGCRKRKAPAGTPRERLPEDYCCPVCGASKKVFRPLAGPGSTKG